MAPNSGSNTYSYSFFFPIVFSLWYLAILRGLGSGTVYRTSLYIVVYWTFWLISGALVRYCLGSFVARRDALFGCRLINLACFYQGCSSLLPRLFLTELAYMHILPSDLFFYTLLVAFFFFFFISSSVNFYHCAFTWLLRLKSSASNFDYLR